MLPLLSESFLIQGFVLFDAVYIFQFFSEQLSSVLSHAPCCLLDKLQWQVGAWGPCLPVSPADVNDVVAIQQPVGGDARQNSLGVTQRNVSCVLVSHETIKVTLVWALFNLSFTLVFWVNHGV